MVLNYKAIGQRIKIARIKKDLTQEQVANVVGVTPAHMSNIETGTTRVSITTLVNIANLLSVTLNDLLCEDIIQARIPFEKDIKEIIDTCSNSEVRIAKAVLRSVVETIKQIEKLDETTRSDLEKLKDNN